MSGHHGCKTLLVHCMDYRLRKYLSDFGSKLDGGYDIVSIAGASKNLDFLMTQVEISVRLHQIEEVILINHEDCGAYGAAGTPEKHGEDLKKARGAILHLHPNLKVTTYYLKLDGVLIGSEEI